MKMTTVTVEIPTNVYPRLALEADLLGYETLAEYIAVTAIAARPPLVFLATNREVEIAVRHGLTDADIAAATGRTTNLIAEQRRALGLAANPRYPRKETGS